MKNDNYNVLGVMSGTSLDGADLAHISLSYNNGKWQYEILVAETVPYTENWVSRLKNAINDTSEQLVLLNSEYTALLAGIITGFIQKNNITGLDVICSHGHTILHRPGEGYTLQIGNLPEIARLTLQTVVCDFRVQDVALGGQGAPLVPVGDRLLFSDHDFCLNLGGFSNISFEQADRRVAYDICAVNTVLNYYANLLGSPYDDGGQLAAAGQLLPGLLAQLEGLDYYKQGYPKSLGYEYARDVLLPLLAKAAAPVKDILHTFTIHIAKQIANAVVNVNGKGSLLITGGGAYNDFLIKNLRSFLPNHDVVIPDDNTVQYKEALIFALLGVLKLRGEVNVLASVTGAKADHSSGVIYRP